MIIILENYNIDSYWATTLLLPLLFTAGVNIDMKITYKEGLKVFSIILVSLYGLIVWFQYSENQLISDIFTIDTLKNIGYTTILLAIGLILFGILPISVLHFKNKLFPRKKWKKSDVTQCSYFIYRKLSNEAVSRTSLEELEILLETHNPIESNVNNDNVLDFYKERLSEQSKITTEDLKEILSLRDRYKKDSGIRILD